jgi:hypothetical protein
MSILIGIASWTDKTLIACGRFYRSAAGGADARGLQQQSGRPGSAQRARTDRDRRGTPGMNLAHLSWSDWDADAVTPMRLRTS